MGRHLGLFCSSLGLLPLLLPTDPPGAPSFLSADHTLLTSDHTALCSVAAWSLLARAFHQDLSTQGGLLPDRKPGVLCWMGWALRGIAQRWSCGLSPCWVLLNSREKGSGPVPASLSCQVPPGLNADGAPCGLTGPASSLLPGGQAGRRALLPQPLLQRHFRNLLLCGPQELASRGP